jgi:hypothetical protein
VPVDEAAVKERYSGLPRWRRVKGLGISGLGFEVHEWFWGSEVQIQEIGRTGVAGEGCRLQDAMRRTSACASWVTMRVFIFRGNDIPGFRNTSRLVPVRSV